MDIFKKTALCGLVSASLIACGGGDSEPASNTNTNNGNTNTTIPLASLTSAESLAKAAAALMVGLAVNEVLYYNASSVIDGKPQGESSCSTSGKVAVSYDSSQPTGQHDGTVIFSDCKTTATRIDEGKLIFQCQTNCDDSLGTSVNLARSQSVSGGVRAVLNGTWSFANGKETYKGSTLITKDALSSQLFFDEGLTSEFVSGGTKVSGKLGIKDGSVQNCLDGSFDYKSTSNLITTGSNQTPTAGVIELSSGSTASGTVTFNNDGSIKVRLTNQTTDTVINKSTFESYCALNQIRAF